MAALVGKWDYVSAENLDQYMEATGVPEALREVAKNSQPSMEIINSGNSWSIKTTVGDRIKDTNFQIGQEFESQSLTGQQLRCIVNLNGETMTEVQKAGDVEVVITRQAAGNELVSNMSFGAVTAVVKFRRA